MERRKFTQEFKLEAVKLLRERGGTVKFAFIAKHRGNLASRMVMRGARCLAPRLLCLADTVAECMIPGKAFEQLISCEAAARRLVRWLRDKKERRFCPGCQGRVIYRLAEGRFRCGRCRYTFGALTGTWLGQSRVMLPTWRG